MRILVLCHGNICRSALCAAVLRSVAGKQHEVRSRGFGPSGKGTPRKWRVVAAQVGHPLEEHRSTQVTLADVRWADQVLYMDGGQVRRLQALTAGHDAWPRNVQGLGSFVGRSRVPDPAFESEPGTVLEIAQLVVRASLQAVADWGLA